jgi:hypothetical protein
MDLVVSTSSHRSEAISADGRGLIRFVDPFVVFEDKWLSIETLASGLVKVELRRRRLLLRWFVIRDVIVVSCSSSKH